MVSAKDVISLYKLLMSNGISLWLTGGWGIDALLGKQTRSHHDLDVIMLFKHIRQVQSLLADNGYSLKEIWEENSWETDTDGQKIATAFVLWDSRGREFDAHAIHLDDQGNGIPAWNAPPGFIFSSQDLGGRGLIKGVPVQCISPEAQVFCHQGYQLPEKHWLDMQLLCKKFDMVLPENFGN